MWAEEKGVLGRGHGKEGPGRDQGKEGPRRSRGSRQGQGSGPGRSGAYTGSVIVNSSSANLSPSSFTPSGASNPLRALTRTARS